MCHDYQIAQIRAQDAIGNVEDYGQEMDLDHIIQQVVEAQAENLGIASFFIL